MKRFIAGWIICGVLAYGIYFGNAQAVSLFPKEYYRKHMAEAVLFGILGPFGLFANYFMTGFAEHGLKFY